MGFRTNPPFASMQSKDFPQKPGSTTFLENKSFNSSSGTGSLRLTPPACLLKPIRKSPLESLPASMAGANSSGSQPLGASASWINSKERRVGFQGLTPGHSRPGTAGTVSKLEWPGVMPGLNRSQSSAAASMESTGLSIRIPGTPGTSPVKQKASAFQRALSTGHIPDQKAAQPGPDQNRTVDLLEYKPRAIRRAAQELLASPDLERTARKIFDSHDDNRNGQLEISELIGVAQELHLRLKLPAPSTNVAKKLMKKYDANNNQMLDFEEFLEMLLALLRKIAYDNTSIAGRDFFVNKNTLWNIWDKWEKQKQLGSGTFGTAYLCKHKITDEIRAIKAVRKSRAKIPVEEIEREILVCRQLDHPHVSRLFQWFEDGTRFYLVMEALLGGTLKDVILEVQKKRMGLKEDWVRKVMKQSAEALSYIHSMRMVHKDIKDENIMLLKEADKLTDPYVVIIDLGIAEMFSYADPQLKECGGTPTTMAPEVWEGSFDSKADVWSLGCVLYEMLAGSMPFMATSLQPRAWTRLHKRGPDWSLVKSSAEGRSLCQAMLTYDSRKRPSMADCLNSSWFAARTSEMKIISAAQFEQLKSFCDQNALKRTMLLQIASRLPMRKAGKIVELFETFDLDGDASLNPEEMRLVFAQMGITDEKTVAKLFATLDVDNDGILSFSEFSAGLLVLFKDILDDRLRDSFGRHDRDGDGYLTRDEAKEFLAGSSSILTPEANAKSYALLDDLLHEGRTKISFEEMNEKLMGHGYELTA